MRIIFKYNKIPFFIWIPKNLVKSKRIQKWIHMEEYSEFIDFAIAECDKYVKENKHFTLVEIEAIEDLNKINIKIKI